ncbi:MAG: hypothetical protein HUU34_14455 [Saprospiraceae bacterium]|nr:hypothetical protein [Saprospiraceae bacterium]
MIRLLYFIAFILLTATACQQAPKAPDQPTAPAAQAAPAAPATPTEQYPSIPMAEIQELWNTCDYIDFIFYEFNFSMNQSEKLAIQSTIGHIAEETPLLTTACKPIGHVFFQVEGKNVLDADLYLDDQCVCYVFYKNGKKVYANKLTQQGVDFYRNIFSQVMKGGQ